MGADGIWVTDTSLIGPALRTSDPDRPPVESAASDAALLAAGRHQPPQGQGLVPLMHQRHDARRHARRLAAGFRGMPGLGVETSLGVLGVPGWRAGRRSRGGVCMTAVAGSLGKQAKRNARRESPARPDVAGLAADLRRVVAGEVRFGAGDRALYAYDASVFR